MICPVQTKRLFWWQWLRERDFIIWFKLEVCLVCHFLRSMFIFDYQSFKMDFYTPTQWVGWILESPCPTFLQNFVAKISAPIGWIDFMFGTWLYKDGAYVISDFDCYWISTSGFLELSHFFHYMEKWRSFCHKNLISNNMVWF